jgi:hypothetical protein
VELRFPRKSTGKQIFLTIPGELLPTLSVTPSPSASSLVLSSRNESHA